MSAENAVQNDGNKPGPLTWVWNEDDLEALLEAIATSHEVHVDLETTGLADWAWTGGPVNGGVAARVVLASLTLPQRADVGDPMSEWDGVDPTTYLVPLSHPQSPWLGIWRSVLRRVMQRVVDFDRPISNANMKFDSRWIYRQTGVSCEHLIVWDTMTASHLFDETSSRKLKVVAPRVFGIDRWDDVDFTSPGAAERTDLWELGTYAARDTYWEWRLANWQRERMFLQGDGVEAGPVESDEIEDARLGRIAVWVSMPTVRSLSRIEQRGIRLDREWAEAHLEEDMQIARQALDDMADRYGQKRGTASAAATSHWFREFTQRAVNAGDLRILSTTKQGNAQWTKGVLGKLSRQGSDVAELVLRQRGAAKRAEYLRAWLHYADREGFIYSTYNEGSVVTGRLSSKDPNMQQVTKKLRPAFIPRDGYHFADFDYSQLELRVAAFVAREMNMIEAFRRGDDLHKLFAARIANKVPEEVTADERQKAKAGNFGLLYLMAAAGFKYYAEDNYGVVMSDVEAARVHKLFFEMWPGLREWHLRTIAKLHSTGQSVSPIGRVRRLPGVWDANPNMVQFSERAAVNSPVQGFGSDLMQMAAASIQGLLPGYSAVPDVFLVGTVHDSIIGEVAISGWQDTVAEVQERMTNLDRALSRLGIEFDVPLVADATIGTRWSWDDISNPKEEAA